MTLGQTIRTERKKRKMTLECLASSVGRSLSVLSGYENDNSTPDSETVEEIAKTLDSNAVRMAYLRNNPVYLSIIPRAFSDLNNIKREPAIIFTKVARECDEARAAATSLAEIFINMDPASTPDFLQRLRDGLEQLLDAKRSIEILETTLVEVGVLTMDGLREVYEQQQNKCIEHNHHDPAKEKA